MTARRILHQEMGLWQAHPDYPVPFACELFAYWLRLPKKRSSQCF